jgi:hypothetical protein
MAKTGATKQISRMLSEDGDSYTWMAAVNGANDAAAYQLATDEPVMPIGGFVSSDPSPTLQQFQTYTLGNKSTRRPWSTASRSTTSSRDE